MRRFAKKALQILGAMSLFCLATPGVLRAGPVATAPEMDPSAGIAALVLLAGAALVIQGRRKK